MRKFNRFLTRPLALFMAIAMTMTGMPGVYAETLNDVPAYETEDDVAVTEEDSSELISEEVSLEDSSDIIPEEKSEEESVDVISEEETSETELLGAFDASTSIKVTLSDAEPVAEGSNIGMVSWEEENEDYGWNLGDFYIIDPSKAIKFFADGDAETQFTATVFLTAKAGQKLTKEKATLGPKLGQFEEFGYTIADGDREKVKSVAITIKPYDQSVVTHTLTFNGEGVRFAAAGDCDPIGDGKATVEQGQDYSFTVTAEEEGWEVKSVTYVMDSNSIELTGNENGLYTIPSVTNDCTITATVGLATYDVTFTSFENAIVKYKGSDDSAPNTTLPDTNKVTVSYGDSFAFKVDANPGYEVTSVKNGETELTAVNGVYTISNITAAITITIATERFKPAIAYMGIEGKMCVTMNTAAIPDTYKAAEFRMCSAETLEDGIYTVLDQCDLSKFKPVELPVEGQTVGEYKIWAALSGEDETLTAESNMLDFTISAAVADTAFVITPASGSESDSSYEKGALTIPAGDYTAATLIYPNGTKKKIEPADNKFTWTDLETGKYQVFFEAVTGEGEGDFIIPTGLEYTLKTPVFIPVSVEEITFGPLSGLDYTDIPYGKVTVSVGKTFSVVAFVTKPSMPSDPGIKIESSDPSVLSVDASGNVKALKAGTADITATANSKNRAGKTVSEKITVTVSGTQKKIKSMKFTHKNTPIVFDSPEVYERGTGIYKELEITLDKDYTGRVVWTVSNSSIAEFSDRAWTIPENGVTTNSIRFHRPGQVTVTATIVDPVYSEKQISCTLTADGYYYDTDNYVQYFYSKNKPITGFIALDPDGFRASEDKDKRFKVIATGNAALKEDIVVYADPATGIVCVDYNTTVIKSGKKLYAFKKADGDWMATLIRGTKDKDTETITGMCVNKSGELQTGWVKIDDKEYYYDPETGLIGKAGQMVQRGKGWTILGDGGLFMSDLTGKYPESSLIYWFNKGIMATGFVFFDKDGTKAVKSGDKDAAFAVYFDPVDCKAVTAPFRIKSKYYYPTTPSSEEADKGIITKIPLNVAYTGVDGQLHATDKNGAAYTNKFFTDANGTIYLDKTGCALKSCTCIIKGKQYTFDADGRIAGNSFAPVINTYVNVEDKYYPVFAKSQTAGKPEKGVVLYYTTAEDPENATDDSYVQIKGAWIYELSGSDYVKTYYADSKGKLVTGIVKIEDVAYWFDLTTSQLGLRDYDGKPQSDSVTFKNKLYWCKTDGSIIQNKGFNYDEKAEEFVFVKDKTGVLATGIYKYEGKSYLFSPKGILLYDKEDPIEIPYKGKYYCTNYGEVGDGKTDPAACSLRTGKKARLEKIDKTLYVIEKDGSLKSGLITVDKKKYYQMISFVEPVGVSDVAGELLMIKGKLYLINNDEEDPYAVTGWHMIEDPEIEDADAYKEYEYDGRYFFYFDPKTCAAVTGFNKLPGLMTDSKGIVIDKDGIPVTDTLKKSVYLNQSATDDIPYGALACDTDVTIKGKLYRFGTDGTVEEGTEGFIYLDNTATDEAYISKKGILATGRTAVKASDGKTAYYYFDPEGRLEKNVVRKTGKKWYYYGTDGKMSTNLTAWTQNNNQVFCNYNKDGSIKEFVIMSGFGVTSVARGCTVLLGTKPNPFKDIVIIGANGLPCVGANTVDNYNSSMTVLVEDDGRVNIPESGQYGYVRFGGKLYYRDISGMIMPVVEGGVRINSESTLNEIISGLSEEEQLRIFTNYNDWIAAKNTLQDDIIPFMILSGEDGSVSAKTIEEGGQQYHLNEYGVPVESYSPFYRSGNNWYINPYMNAIHSKYEHGFTVQKGVPGSWCLNLVDMNKAMKLIFDKLDEQKALEDSMINAKITWDGSGKIISITDSVTGSKLNGMYEVLDVMLDDQNHREFFINIKKGSLVTNTKYVNLLGFTRMVTFDSYGGLGIEVSFAE